ncbi:TRAP transporter small permease [Alkalihalophilus lindianensis]|uniref:TRAP transporter small permease n=1 Tax=Alkalihalophilus lindianensis TaxID=1630542 RepID=A0ABU3XDR9_9BACI|nr:TRAP transporter small permease [Alkalihalophilus lindianensis]MDV2686034.1 TRAP transporter small permease [Alkalihalophilus lindianensis]
MIMTKVDYILEKLTELIIVVFLGLTVFITLLQVFFRYVLEQPLGWSQEALLICFVYSVLFGAALCIYKREHLQVDMLEKAPAWAQKIISTLEFTVVLIMIVVLIYFGWQLVQANFQSGQIVGLLPIKSAYVYLAIPLSGLLMLYFHVRQVVK